AGEGSGRRREFDEHVGGRPQPRVGQGYPIWRGAALAAQRPTAGHQRSVTAPEEPSAVALAGPLHGVCVVRLMIALPGGERFETKVAIERRGRGILRLR